MRDGLKDNHPLMSTLNQCCFFQSKCTPTFQNKAPASLKCPNHGWNRCFCSDQRWNDDCFWWTLDNQEEPFQYKWWWQNPLCGGSTCPRHLRTTTHVPLEELDLLCTLHSIYNSKGILLILNDHFCHWWDAGRGRWWPVEPAGTLSQQHVYV